MSPQSEEPDRDESLDEDAPACSEDLDATEDGSHLLPDSDATVDAVPASSDAQAQPNSESANESPDSDATYIPGSVVQNKVKDWESSLSEDSEPGQTLKPPHGTDETTASTVEQSVVLKRRDVSRQGNQKNPSTADESDQADYRTDKLLGEGGMGAVYSARQESMDRPVAIKVLKPRAARLESSRRTFVSEAIITGSLDHPNIVPIYDVAKQADDSLFYSMKQVEGVEWKDRLAQNSVDANLEILLRVSDAVAFAHERCFVHRDLKPANIMLGAFGEVLVMDWGLAMPTPDHPRRESFPPAKRGGTPHYMAPEMVDDPMLGVDRRSDVYLLGAILFEIVTGKPPHKFDSASGSRRERVKACLAAVAQNLIVDTDESSELVEIARKAMATDPAARYQTVSEFQVAVRDHLEHEESIELAAHAAEALSTARLSGDYDDFSRARFGFETALDRWPSNSRAIDGLKSTRKTYAQTAFERGDFDLALSLLNAADGDQSDLATTIQAAQTERDSRTKRIRRLRQFSFATSLAIAILASGAAVWINSERDKALTAQQEEATQRGIAQQKEQEAQKERQAAVIAEKKAKEERQQAIASREETEATLARSNYFLAQARWDNNRVADARELMQRVPQQHRNFEWYLARRQFEGSDVTLYGHENVVSSVSFSPDGTWIASGSFDQTIRLWDAATGEELHTLEGHMDDVTSVSFSPDGVHIGSGSWDQTIRLWDALTGEELHTLNGHMEGISSVSFSPDGTRIASGSHDHTIRLWDAANGEELHTLNGHMGGISSVSFSPDGTRIASGSHDHTIRLWDAATGEELDKLEGHTSPVTSVSFSPDGTRITSGSWDQTIRLWDAATGEELHILEGHTDEVYSVSFSPNGTRIASGSNDQTIRLWDEATGEELDSLEGHTGTVSGVSFSPDGTRIASGSWDKTSRLWNISTGEELHTLNGHASDIFSVSFSPDGTRIASGSHDHTIRLWDAATGEELDNFEGHTSPVTSVNFSPDGTRIVSGSWDDTIRLWDASTGQELRTLKGHTSPVTSVSFSPDGTRIASGSWDQSIRLWDAATGEELHTLEAHTDGVYGVSFSPNGTCLASGSHDQTIRLWDASTGQELRTLEGHTGQVKSVNFSRDGTRIVSGSWDNTIRLWDASTGQELRMLKGHTSPVTSVIFSPDGTRVASGSWDDTIRFWDASTGEELHTLEGHMDEVFSLSFSPDGTRMASGGRDDTIRLWDASMGQETHTLKGHTDDVWSVSFSPDGTRIASGSGDGTIRVWDASTGKETHTLKGHTDVFSSLSFSLDGTRLLSRAFNGQELIWELKSGEVLPDGNVEEFPADYDSSKTSDGRWLAIPSTRDVLLVDLNYKKSPRERQRRKLLARPKSRWHRKQFEAARSAKQWYVAVFHAAWLLKITPSDVSLHDDLHETHRQLLSANNGQSPPPLPAVVVKILKLSRGTDLPTEAKN